MKNFSNFVKHFRKSFCSTPFKLHNTLLSPRPAKTAALQGGAHYIDIKHPVNTFFENTSNVFFQTLFAVYSDSVSVDKKSPGIASGANEVTAEREGLPSGVCRGKGGFGIGCRSLVRPVW